MGGHHHRSTLMASPPTLLLSLLLMVVAAVMALPPEEESSPSHAEAEHLQRYHGRHRGHGRSRPPHAPPSPPSPPPPPGPGPLPFCDCRCNCSQCRVEPDPPIRQPWAGGRGRGSPTPPSPPTFRPRPGSYFGFPVPASPAPPGNAAAAAGGLECVAPLAGLMACGTFLTGSEPETPTPQSECCSGLGAFLNSSSAGSTTGDGGDRTLRCLCPVILGDVNKMLPKPLDPVRMMYQPIACGVVLPPQVLYICFTGHQSLVTDSWGNGKNQLTPGATATNSSASGASASPSSEG